MTPSPPRLSSVPSFRVPYVRLDNPAVASFKTGVQVNRSLLAKSGRFPVLNGGIQPSGYYDHFNTVGPAITVNQGGSAGYVRWVSSDFWAGSHCYVVTPGSAVDHRYLFHVLKWREGDIRSAARGTTIPGLARSALGQILVPVPPLEAQRTIARALDHFTDLESALESELSARKLQYAYYRDSFFASTEFLGEAWRPLGEVYEFSSGLSKSADHFGYGQPFLSFKTVFSNITVPTVLDDLVNSTEAEQERYSIRAGDVFVTRTSEDLEGLGMSSAAVRDYPKATFNGFTKRLRPKGDFVLDPEYAAHFFRSDSFRTQISRMAIQSTRVSLNNAMLAGIRIPVPLLERQLKVKELLNSLDALVNDLSIGLPAELAARRKQYEYYRDKLLTFEEAPA